MEESYQYYDKAGNRIKRTAGGVEELYQYDSMLKDNKAEYTYDAFNRTEKVETFDGHVQINRYDAEGLRHELEEDGKLVQFIFRGDEAVTEEKDGSIIRFIRGYDLIASDAENARTYYHYASDEMSSITHVVEGTDVLNRYEYDAWGNTTVCEETVENRFRFNGQQLDPITQQYYLRARFYNPVIARFTQEDTYRGDGLNLYAYCGNNPVYYEDPSGHVPQCVKDAYKKYRESGMSPQEALNQANLDYFVNKNKNNPNCKTDSDVMNRALVDLEVHRAMQKYQMLVNVMDIDRSTQDPRPWVHGTKVHTAVHNLMDTWVTKQGFKTINVYTEIYHNQGNAGQGGINSSRIDLVIQENNKTNSMANPQNYYIGDIKTGKTTNGSTYGLEQMNKNQDNVLGYPTNYQNIPGVTHWQFNPDSLKPQQNYF